MPLEHFAHGAKLSWGRWKLVESESELWKEVAPYETVPDTISNEFKRLEFLGGRVLIKRLMEQTGLSFQGLTKNEHGKPFLKDSKYSVSLSHSYPYVAAVIGRNEPVGIDLEQPKEKLLKIAPRVLHPDELVDAGADVVKHCIYWCAKETLVKIHGKKDLAFAENLRISAFSMQNTGQLIGRIIVNARERAIPLQYFVHDQFVMVVNR